MGVGRGNRKSILTVVCPLLNTCRVRLCSLVDVPWHTLCPRIRLHTKTRTHAQDEVQSHTSRQKKILDECAKVEAELRAAKKLVSDKENDKKAAERSIVSINQEVALIRYMHLYMHACIHTWR